MANSLRLERAFSPTGLFVVMILNCAALAQSDRGRFPEESGRQAQRATRIEGRVLDEAGQPIENAQIMVYPAGFNVSSAFRQASSLAVLKPATTDEDGRFSVGNLKGVYNVAASVPGYVSTDEGDRAEPKYYRPGDSVTFRLVKGGVITGRVTGAAAEPVVGITVRAVKVTRPGDRTSASSQNRQGATDSQSLQREMMQPFSTDDRGVYRIYGLETGTYLVSAGGGRSFLQAVDPFSGYAPTYHPSSTRGGAAEVSVRAGEESAGIDIRFRNERGHAVSGSVTGQVGSGPGFNVNMIGLGDPATGGLVGVSMTLPLPGNTNNRFVFDGISDGDYCLQAVAGDYSAASNVHRLSVKGDDVTGVELTLTPFSSISGRLDIEKPATQPATCKPAPRLALEETVVQARPDRRMSKATENISGLQNFLFKEGSDAVPDNKGEFKVGMLRDGLYRIEPRLAGEDYYVRSVTLPSESPAEKASAPRRDAARAGIAIKGGQNVNGLLISVSPGAAGLSGRVSSAADSADAGVAETLRVYLVPSEKEAADDALRFAETLVNDDGAFKFTNISPGRYWVVVRNREQQRSDNSYVRLAWYAEGRALLRAAGEKSKSEVELQPCQRVKDYALKYSPTPSERKPPQPAAVGPQ